MSFGLLLVYVAILAVNSGGNGILLPNIVAGIDEAGKIGNLAHRHHGRLHRQHLRPARSPGPCPTRPGRASGAARRGWSVARSSPAASSSACRWRSRCSTVALVWLVVQVGVNALQAAATALVPDRYPAARRGGVSGDDRRRHHDRQRRGRGRRRWHRLAGDRSPTSSSRPWSSSSSAVFVLANRDEPSTHLAPRAHRRQGLPPRLLGRARASTPTSPGPSGRASSWSSASTAPRPTASTSCATTSASATRSRTPSPRRWASSSWSASCSPRSSAAGSPTASGRRKPFIVWSSVVMSIALAIPLVVPTTQRRPGLRLPARPRASAPTSPSTSP